MARNEGKGDVRDDVAAEKAPVEPTLCGLIMPISAIDGMDAAHWSEVKDILSSALEDAGFTPNLVSEGDDSSVIHKRIIQNIYEYPIMVCDVSGRNPNVMFELGMRLAFDKPTIVVKDDVTSYPFDTAPLEYLTYPRDLRFHGVVNFKKNLAAKVLATFRKSVDDPSYSSYLGHLGQFKVAKLDTTEVPATELLAEQMAAIWTEMRVLSKTVLARSTDSDIHSEDTARTRIVATFPASQADAVLEAAAKMTGVRSVRVMGRNKESVDITFTVSRWSELASPSKMNEFLAAHDARGWTTRSSVVT